MYAHMLLSTFYPFTQFKMPEKPMLSTVGRFSHLDKCSQDNPSQEYLETPVPGDWILNSAKLKINYSHLSLSKWIALLCSNS